MLGYSCLAHSYWQRCHKTGLRGAVSGEEESGGEANQERTICMSSRLLPSGSLSLSLSLCNISSLHCIIHSFAKAIKCQDIRLPQAVSLAFPLPACLHNNAMWDWRKEEEKKEKQLVELESDERRRPRQSDWGSFSRCHRQLEGIFLTATYMSHILFYLRCSPRDVKVRTILTERALWGIFYKWLQSVELGWDQI